MTHRRDDVPPSWRRVFRLPWLDRRVAKREVDDEVAFHLDMRAQKLASLGATNTDAKQQALARFGDPDLIKDEVLAIDHQYAQEVRLMEWFASIWSDLRYAGRTFRRSPVFTAVVTLTLALGIGATSAVFSLVDGVLLKPLAFKDPGQVVQVLQAYHEKGLDQWALSQANAAVYQQRQRSFSAFGVFANRLRTLTGLDRPLQLRVNLFQRDVFNVLGVQPLIGRVFSAEEDAPKGPAVAVLRYAFWQSEFGGDPNILGRVLDLDGVPTKVIGVMPASFDFGGDNAMILPLQLDRTQKWGWFLIGVGRLRPGVTVAQAQRDLTDILWQMGREDPNLVSRTDPPPEGAGLKSIVRPMRDAYISTSAKPLLIVQTAACLILLIACANVATLLSSRGAVRARELALRTALGASARRVLRQMLTETVALSLLGAAAGVGIAYGGVRLLPHLPVQSISRATEVSVNGSVLLMTLAIALAAGLFFGMLPAFQQRAAQLRDNLADGHRGSASGASRRLQRTLVVAQLALSVVLLVGAGLMLQSVHRLLTVNFGFQPEGITNISLPMPVRKYAITQTGMNQTQSATIGAFSNTLVENVRAVPGVKAAAVTWGPPFWGSGSCGYSIEGHQANELAGDEPQTVTAAVSPGYFGTMEIPLLRGRDFNSTDLENSVAVTVVDETLAKRFWAEGAAVGHRLKMCGDSTWRTIVGVVGGIRDNNPADPPMPHTYFPYTQQPGRFINLEVRTSGDARRDRPVLAAVLNTIAKLEPDVPRDNVTPLTQAISGTIADNRLTELLLSMFAGLAIVLAAVGIYGVMTLFVTNRRREFGIRLAIGAKPAGVTAMVLRQGLALAATGVVLGVVAALYLTRWMQGLLYEVQPTDPVTFTLLPLALVLIAVGCCYPAARRAATSDPLEVLRSD